MINVDSEVGRGSCFSFFIPKNMSDGETVDDEPAERAAVILPAQETPATEYPVNPTATHSVLVIDDERGTVDLLERNLSSDFKVFKAYDGEDGLAVARAQLPDIIVCDLMMPRMDGMQFLQTLKNDKTLQHIKVIIFTAKTSEEDMIRAFDNGADAYLTKPVSLKYLRTRIDRMVAQADNAEVAASISKERKSYNKEEQIFLLRCREIIDDNLQNEDFSIDMLADRLAMSHSSLYKKIKTMTGMSLIEFVNDYKIYRAVQLFRGGVTSVDAVREQCGFGDVKNFRQMFKRKMGVSPKQYVLNEG
jgi:DNA-binding response OmpR family regulator